MKWCVHEYVCDSASKHVYVRICLCLRDWECICACVGANICVYICKCICTYALCLVCTVHVWAGTLIFVSVYVCIVYTHIFVSLHIHTCAHICMCLLIYVNAWESGRHMLVCMYTHAHLYIHTCAHNSRRCSCRSWMPPASGGEWKVWPRRRGRTGGWVFGGLLSPLSSSQLAPRLHNSL